MSEKWYEIRLFLPLIFDIYKQQINEIKYSSIFNYKGVRILLVDFSRAAMIKLCQ